MQTGEIVSIIKNGFKDLKNEENRETIETILEKLETMPDEKVIQYAKMEQILDQEDNLNQYILERFINFGIKNGKKLEKFQEQYGKEGTKEERFEYKNKLVMLELAVGNSPIEMHVEETLPEGLLNNEKTRLSTVGMKILTIAFCDALFKIGKEWNTKGKEWGDADQLVLSSFMLSNGTVKLLNDLEIGFDAKYLKLEPTNLKEPPKVLSKEISEEEIKKITPYIDRYAIHRDINKNKIPTRNIGYAKISRDNLTKTESLDKILLKIKELEKEIEQYHSSKGIDIKSEEEKYGITSLTKFQEKEINKISTPEIGEEKCYHMTPDLEAIMQDEDKALKPKIGKSSERVNDVKNLGLSYSLGLEGIIVTNAFFKARYQYELLENEKNKEISLDDMFGQDVKHEEDENLNSRVYLSFDETEAIRKENTKRDISDPKTKSPVSLDKVKGVVVKNIKTGEIRYDRESIVRYAISKKNIEDILSKIQKCDIPYMNMEGYAKTEFSFKQYVERYYEEMSKDPEIIKYTNGEYGLEEITLEELLKMMEMNKVKEISEGKSGFDDSMEAEIKVSDVQKATHKIREEVQPSKTKEEKGKTEEEIGDE